MHFVGLSYFISKLVSIFPYTRVLNLITSFFLITALTKKWSQSTLRPFLVFTPFIIPFFVCVYYYIINLTSCIFIWWQPCYFMYLCWKLVLITTILFAHANSHNNSPFLFVSSCKVCWPVTLLYDLSFPSWAFTVPKIIIISFLGVLSSRYCRLL